MALVTDLVNPAELVGQVRGLAIEENNNPHSLAAVLPTIDHPDIEYRITKGNLLDVDSAVYRALDAESPIGKRQGVTRIMGEIPPISLKLQIGEEERLRLQAANSRDNAALIQQVYDDARITTRAILNRVERARGEVLYTGKLILAENGVSATVDYGRKAGHTVAAGTVWSNPAADVLGDMAAWVSTYVDSNGIEPGYALASKQIINALLLNTGIRNTVASAAGTPNRLRRTDLDGAISDFGLPPLVEYNTVVRVDGTQTRVIPTDRLVFMPPSGEPLGNVLTAITAEALELVDSGYLTSSQAPGLTSVVLKTFDPVARWTKTAGLVLPVLSNPDLTFAADVL